MAARIACPLLTALVILVAPLLASAQNSVLLIVLDDIGTDLVGAYAESSEIYLTPQLDALAQEGLLFRNAWVAPYCSATRAAILTGRHGFRTGVGAAQANLQPDHPTLPLFLGDTPSMMAGKWHTTPFGLNSAGVVVGYTPLETGFQEFRGTPMNFEFRIPHALPDFFNWEKWVETPTGFTITPMSAYATSETVDDVLLWTADQTEPWFVMLSFHAAHIPDQVPPEELHTQVGVKAAYSPGDVWMDDLAAHYDVRNAVVEALDTEIGRLLAGIDREHTAVLVLGDNGSGQVVPDAVNRGSKGSVWEGGINVPLIVVGAGTAVGAESQALVHATDLFPTILELMGRPPAPHDIDGVSFAAILGAPAAEGREAVYTDGFFNTVQLQPPSRHDVAVRDSRYKLIRRGCGSGGSELYDLLLDPHEDVNLLSDPSGPGVPPALSQFLLETAGARICDCSDGIDDDGDGLVDYLDDPGCAGDAGGVEKHASLPCDDGVDNEILPDGWIDYRADGSGDPGCRDPSWPTEEPPCQDGINNDGEIGTDFDGGESVLGAGNGDPDGPDPHCGAPWVKREAPPPYPCGLGIELALLMPPLIWLSRRRRV